MLELQEQSFALEIKSQLYLRQTQEEGFKVTSPTTIQDESASTIQLLPDFMKTSFICFITEYTLPFIEGLYDEAKVSTGCPEDGVLISQILKVDGEILLFAKNFDTEKQSSVAILDVDTNFLQEPSLTIFPTRRTQSPQRPILSFKGSLLKIAKDAILPIFELRAVSAVLFIVICASVLVVLNEAVASMKLILEMQNNRLTIYILEGLLCISVAALGISRECGMVDCSKKCIEVSRSLSSHIEQNYSNFQLQSSSIPYHSNSKYRMKLRHRISNLCWFRVTCLKGFQ